MELVSVGLVELAGIQTGAEEWTGLVWTGAGQLVEVGWEQFSEEQQLVLAGLAEELEFSGQQLVVVEFSGQLGQEQQLELGLSVELEQGLSEGLEQGLSGELEHWMRLV